MDDDDDDDDVVGLSGQHDDVILSHVEEGEDLDEEVGGFGVELSQHDDVLSQQDVSLKETGEVREESVKETEEVTSTQEKDWSHLVVFTAHKAGMEKDAKRSKEEINRVIYESSKNSKFFQNARQRDRELDKRIEKLKTRLEEFRKRNSSRNERTTQSKYSQLLTSLEQKRDLTHTWCVVDMDMFFASVEMRDNPTLRGKPIAVGGMGMISTANYEARKYGVRSAMPGFIAKKLCPELIFVKPNFEKYVQVAKITREIFARYDPDFSAMSLDEASLDLTKYIRDVELKKKTLLNDDDDDDDDDGGGGNRTIAERVVTEIRNEIFKLTRCTASAGIAPNRMLAKIASEKKKPNGQYFIKANATSCIEFMRNTKLRKIPGVGKVTERILREVLSLETCGELLVQPRVTVEIDALFKHSMSRWLLSASLGIATAERSDEHKRSVGPTRKGISVERTFRVKFKRVDLLSQLKSISTSLSSQMREKGLFGKTLTLKLKSEDFRVISRSKTSSNYIQNANDIFRIAKPFLLAQLPLRLRLMGIRLANFKGAAAPLAKGQKKLSKFFQKGDVKTTTTTTSMMTTTPITPPPISKTKTTVKRKRQTSLVNMFTKSPPLKKNTTTTPSGWTCRQCTFHNIRQDYLACEACNTPRYQNLTPSQ